MARRRASGWCTLAFALWLAGGGTSYAQPELDALRTKVQDLRTLSAESDVDRQLTPLILASDATGRAAVIAALVEGVRDPLARDVFLRGVLLCAGRAETGLSLETRLELLHRALEGRLERRADFRDVVQRFEQRERLVLAAIAQLGAAEAAPADPTVLWLVEQLIATDAQRREVIGRLIELGRTPMGPAERMRVVEALRRISLQSLRTVDEFARWNESYGANSQNTYGIFALHREERARWLEAARATVRYLAGRGDLRGILPYLDGERGDDQELILLALRSLVQAAGLDRELRGVLVLAMIDRWPALASRPALERVALEALPGIVPDAPQHQKRLIEAIVATSAQLEELPSDADLERIGLVARVLVSCSEPEATAVIEPVARSLYGRLEGWPAPAEGRPDLASAARRELVAGFARWAIPMDMLARALQDQDAGVRQFAGNALALRDDPAVALPLARALRSERVIANRVALARNLAEVGHFGETEVREVIAAVVERDESPEVRTAAASAAVQAIGKMDGASSKPLREAVLRALNGLDATQRVALLAAVPARPEGAQGELLIDWIPLSTAAAERARIINLISATEGLVLDRRMVALRGLVDVEPALLGLAEALASLRRDAEAATPPQTALAIEVSVLEVESKLATATSAEALAPIAAELDRMALNPESRAMPRMLRVRARLLSRLAQTSGAGGNAEAAQAWREALELSREAGETSGALALEAGEHLLRLKELDEVQRILAEIGAPQVGRPLARRHLLLVGALALAEGRPTAAAESAAMARRESGPPADAAVDQLDLSIAIVSKDARAWVRALELAERLRAMVPLDAEVEARLAVLAAGRERLRELDRALDLTAALSAFTAAPQDPDLQSRWLLLDVDEVLGDTNPDLERSARRLAAYDALFASTGRPRRAVAKDQDLTAHRLAWEAVRADLSGS